MIMKKLILGLILAWPAMGLAAGDAPAYDIDVDSTDVHSLQRGARIFVNYCMGCHSASYMRYNRMGKDLGISEEVLRENFMFGVSKSGSTMDIAMKSSDGEKFFGVAPPDLSVIARSRGEDWLYSYFMTFYRDPDRPFGVNNLTFKDVAMPHVLWERQGIQEPVKKTIQHDDGSKTEVIERLELVTPGTESPEQYAATVYDLVNFLDYLAEPAKFKRHRLGIWVIVYLLCFLVLAWMLKKEYWKDVH